MNSETSCFEWVFFVLCSIVLLFGCSAEQGSSQGYLSDFDYGSMEQPEGSGASGGGGSFVPVVVSPSPVEPVRPPGGEWLVGVDAGVRNDTCATFSAQATKVERQVEKEVPVEIKVAQPVSIYIMLDQSGSMWIPDLTLAFK